MPDDRTQFIDPDLGGQRQGGRGLADEALRVGSIGGVEHDLALLTFKVPGTIYSYLFPFTASCATFQNLPSVGRSREAITELRLRVNDPRLSSAQRRRREQPLSGVRSYYRRRTNYRGATVEPAL